MDPVGRTRGDWDSPRAAASEAGTVGACCAKDRKAAAVVGAALAWWKVPLALRTGEQVFIPQGQHSLLTSGELWGATRCTEGAASRLLKGHSHRAYPVLMGQGRWRW